MKSKRGLAFAVTGASIGLLGVSITVAGLAYQLAGPNLGPAVVFGPLIAAVGVLLSFVTAMALEE